mgnify:CR=1 FL=1
MLTSNLEVLTMTMILDATSHACNTQANLSTDERRAVRFLVAAHYTIDRIAHEIRRTPEAVEAYCKSVFINAK